MPIRPLVDRTYLEQVLLSRFSHGEVQQWVQKYFQPYRELMSYYRCAIMEVETKFNVLNEELSLQYDRNPCLLYTSCEGSAYPLKTCP